MIIVIFILLFIFDIQSLLVVEGTTTTSSHVFTESIRGLSMRKDLKKTSRASALLHHTVIFAVQQRNLDELEKYYLMSLILKVQIMENIGQNLKWES